MVSSAIWKKTCTSEFFKDDRNCTDECNLKSLKNSLVHVFSNCTRNILLLINNIQEKLLKIACFDDTCVLNYVI